MLKDKNIYMYQLIDSRTGDRSPVVTGTVNQFCEQMKNWQIKQHKLFYVIVLCDLSDDVKGVDDFVLRFPIQMLYTFLAANGYVIDYPEEPTMNDIVSDEPGFLQHILNTLSGSKK